jgi:pyruvate,water dikinase
MFTRFEDFAIYSQDFISPTPPPAPSMLRGQCASPGVVSGPCKIVLNKKDGANVMTGDIMVAVGTDFDLIDAMHRAAAVVTEEGGILSHAAVVCREMQKPCCIGLKNATHLLRDGVAVRVDATQGEVVLIAKETV